jgi:peroxidase
MMATRLFEFRTIDGSGNNLDNPLLNAAGSAEIRIAPANFAPGTVNGLIDATNAREISNVISSGPEAEASDPNGYSAWMYVWGQFIDHDLDLTATDGVNHIDITIPPGDPDLSGDTIPMTRFVTGPGGTAVNSISGWIDGSQVYGSDAANAASLRLPDGHLKTSPGNNLPIVNGSFVSGDIRVAENPDLTTTTTLFVREHNFQVDRLHQEHPDWTGDQLYQMARAIVGAEIANITYTEFLPKLIGKDAISPYHGYDPKVDPRITQEFATAAFRFGHSIVSGEETKIDNLGVPLAAQSLTEAFLAKPADVVANGGIDALQRDFAADVAQKSDVYAIGELRNLLFDPPVALDLIAIDIQRERDLGLGTLNQTREALGLTPYTDFDQITSDPAVLANLQQIFATVDDVDLFIGGLAEDCASGVMVGETFQKIIAQQFESLRDGDRLWWQNQGFDEATRELIAQSTLGAIEVRNNDTTVIQHDVFVAAERHSSDVAAAEPDGPQLVIGIDADDAVISGGPADDTIVAGLGQNQMLTGGSGSDVFMFISSHQNATITDFSAQTDKLEFTMSAHDFSVTKADDGHAVVHYGGNTIDLLGVAPRELDQVSIILPDGEGIESHGRGEWRDHPREFADHFSGHGDFHH